MVKIKWHLQSKQVKYRVNLNHSFDRDEIKQIS